MRRCETVLWEEKLKRVPDFDVRLDPDHTGLVGEEFTALATTQAAGTTSARPPSRKWPGPWPAI